MSEIEIVKVVLLAGYGLTCGLVALIITTIALLDSSSNATKSDIVKTVSLCLLTAVTWPISMALYPLVLSRFQNYKRDRELDRRFTEKKEGLF